MGTNPLSRGREPSDFEEVHPQLNRGHVESNEEDRGQWFHRHAPVPSSPCHRCAGGKGASPRPCDLKAEFFEKTHQFLTL